MMHADLNRDNGKNTSFGTINADIQLLNHQRKTFQNLFPKFPKNVKTTLIKEFQPNYTARYQIKGTPEEENVVMKLLAKARIDFFKVDEAKIAQNLDIKA